MDRETRPPRKLSSGTGTIGRTCPRQPEDVEYVTFCCGLGAQVRGRLTLACSPSPLAPVWAGPRSILSGHGLLAAPFDNAAESDHFDSFSNQTPLQASSNQHTLWPHSSHCSTGRDPFSCPAIHSNVAYGYALSLSLSELANFFQSAPLHWAAASIRVEPPWVEAKRLRGSINHGSLDTRPVPAAFARSSVTEDRRDFAAKFASFGPVSRRPRGLTEHPSPGEVTQLRWIGALRQPTIRVCQRSGGSSRAGRLTCYMGYVVWYRKHLRQHGANRRPRRASSFSASWD